MKKHGLGLILALSLLTVTGGVYATWTYYTGAVQAIEDKTTTINLASKDVQTTAKGKFTLNKNDVKINIDAKSASDYTTVVSASGNLVFNYVPEKGADPLGNLTATVSLDSTSVFEIKTATIACSLSGSTITIPGSSILAALTFKPQVLETQALYDTFATNVSNTHITVKLEEK